MTGKDALYGVGAIVAALVAFKVFKTASTVSAAGGKIVDGVKAGVVELVTKDLNPASTENVVYRAANVLTGGDNSKNSIGTRIYDSDFRTSPNYTGLNKLVYDFFNPEKKPIIETIRPTAIEDFRRSELISQNEASVELAKADVQMSDRRNAFRLTEINQDPLRQYSTDYEIWQAPAINQSTGA